MKAKDIIEFIKKAVLDVKKTGQELISVDAMGTFLDALKSTVEDPKEVDNRHFEASVQFLRSQHEQNLVILEAQQRSELELFRSVIGYGQAAMKSAILINGGATVALLALIGNIWVKGINPDAIGSLTDGIRLFAFGTLTAAVGTAASCVTQYCYMNFGEKAAKTFHILTVLCVVGAFLLFGLGTIESHQAFIEHLTANYVIEPE